MLSRAVFRAAWIGAVAVGLGAGPGWASEVVEVRVGNHPTFTRVVFELDAPAGYRVERRTAEDGVAEILVTLDAGSTPRSVATRSVMVERVAVQDGLEQSVAHIRLRKSPSRVKELILADPPRIVFDMMLPESELQAAKLAAARKAEAKAKARAEAEEPKPGAAPEPAAPPEKPTATQPVPKPAAEPVAKAEEAPAPKVLLPVEPEVGPAPGPAVAELPEARPGPEAAKAEAAKEPVPGPEAAKAEAARELVPGPEVLKPPKEAPRAVAKPAAREAPKRAEPKRAAARPHRPRPVSPSGGGISWVAWGGAAVGALAVLLAVVLVLRRRALPNDLDVTALAEEEAGGEGVIPAGGFAMGTARPEGAELRSEGAVSREIPVEESRPGGPGIAAGPGLFDDEAEKESETMDTESPAMRMEHTASELPTHMGAGAEGEGDLARLVRELERRVAQLETRLDETIDSRERLERQVAAQSEELRVQRAAIARTQRALRSLNRSGEEQATEPALREPAK